LSQKIFLQPFCRICGIFVPDLKIKPAYLFLILAMIFVSVPDLSAQCSMCKQAAETSLKSNPGSLARSLNSGILYLMAAPYLLIAFIFRKQIYQLWKKVSGRRKPVA
jgi:hypothetical protein